MESTCFLFCLHRKNQFGGRKMLFTALITGKTAIFILKVHFLLSQQQQNNKNNLKEEVSKPKNKNLNFDKFFHILMRIS